MGLTYAGAITPTEAYRLRETGAATIVDVRTQPEWDLVGHVAGTSLIEWPRTGERLALAAFLDELRTAFDPTQALLFICRSGVRSHYAAQLAAHAGTAARTTCSKDSRRSRRRQRLAQRRAAVGTGSGLPAVDLHRPRDC